MEIKQAKQLLLNASKIAVVRTDKIGDMILTLPLCKALKEINPNSQLSFIANSMNYPLLHNNKYIDEVFFVDKYKNGIKDIFKANSFDAVFFPRPQFNEILPAFFKLIKLRIGSGYRWYSFLFNHRIYEHRRSAEKNEAEYNISLLENTIGKPVKTELIPPVILPETRIQVDNILKDHCFNEATPYFIIHPGSRGSARDWKADNFGVLARQILHKYNFQCVITGVKDELGKCLAAHNQCLNAINLCGKLNLTQMIALISQASFFVSNSTGVIHLAAASNVWTVGFYPNTPEISAQRWGPFTDKRLIFNPPPSEKKYNDEMNTIDVDMVFVRVDKLIKEKILIN